MPLGTLKLGHGRDVPRATAVSRGVDHSWAAGTLVFLTPDCSWMWCPGRVREVPDQSARGPEVCVRHLIRNKLLIWGRILNAFFQHFRPPFSLQSAPSPRGPSAVRTPGPSASSRAWRLESRLERVWTGSRPPLALQPPCGLWTNSSLEKKHFFQMLNYEGVLIVRWKYLEDYIFCLLDQGSNVQKSFKSIAYCDYNTVY